MNSESNLIISQRTIRFLSQTKSDVGLNLTIIYWVSSGAHGPILSDWIHRTRTDFLIADKLSEGKVRIVYIIMKSFVPKRAIHQYGTFSYSTSNLFRVHPLDAVYIIYLSEMILLRVKNRIEIVFFSKTHYIHWHFFSKTHYIHPVIRAQFFIKRSHLQNINQ